MRRLDELAKLLSRLICSHVIIMGADACKSSETFFFFFTLDMIGEAVRRVSLKRCTGIKTEHRGHMVGRMVPCCERGFAGEEMEGEKKKGGGWLQQ